MDGDQRACARRHEEAHLLISMGFRAFENVAKLLPSCRVILTGSQHLNRVSVLIFREFLNVIMLMGYHECWALRAQEFASCLGLGLWMSIVARSRSAQCRVLCHKLLTILAPIGKLNPIEGPFLRVLGTSIEYQSLTAFCMFDGEKSAYNHFSILIMWQITLF